MKLVITESQMYKIVRRLNEGSSKEDKVKKIQQFLVDNGYDLGDYGNNEDGIDGEYGGLTKKAVEEFQRKKGLDVDGKVGPKTAEVMGVEPVFKKRLKDSESKEKDETSSDKVTNIESTGDWVKESGKRYTYHLPSDYQNKKVHLLFAGNDSSTSTPCPSRYKSQIESSGVLNNVIFVVTDYQNSLSNAKEFIKNKFGKNISSVAGFSAGGYDAWDVAGDSSYQLVGLIDPSTPESKRYSSTKSLFSSNVYMVCNFSNWGAYKGIQGRLKEFCDNQSSRIICNKRGHWDNLNEFYILHGDKLK
jgi:peptidoglycan hydrolase-like protein with peptidoglycan-binding domain